ncbi:MAG: O-antigen ligase family protein [Lentisphaerae bacterium]|nr:O-antigen ligase family protein [Lentisphaerota bacterium]
MGNKILFVIVAALGVYLVMHGIGRLPTLGLLGVIVFFAALAISFVRGTAALYIIIFAMLFSPEVWTPLATGRTAGAEGAAGAGTIIVRLEDLILIAVGCGWLLRTAYQKRQFGIMSTPVNPAIWFYIATFVVATMLGVLGGTVRLEAGIVHNLKFCEYFFLFFMILAHVRKKEIIGKMLAAMLVAFFVAMLYAYTQMEWSGAKRLVAPYDDEPNTFGGYIVLLMCLAAGIALTDQRPRVRVPLVLLLLLALPPLLFTLSRAGYTAFIAGVLAFLALSQQRIIIGALTIGLVAALVMSVALLPASVQQRIAGTFRTETQFKAQMANLSPEAKRLVEAARIGSAEDYYARVAGIELDSSTAARIFSYQIALKAWEENPFLGKGVTGTHFIDSQYFRMLAETGLIGLGAFLFMIWRLLRSVWQVYGQCQEPFLKGAALGLVCGIIATMAHAITANSFIIIRIAEPLWLLAGLILLVPQLKETGETTASAELYSS